MEYLYAEGLLQKRLSLGMNVRGIFMAHVLCEIFLFYIYIHFSKLYGYVTHNVD